MEQEYTIYYGILTAFYGIIAITTIIGSIIYTFKKRNLAGVLMIVGSIFQLISTIASPIITTISSRYSVENIITSNLIISSVGTIFSIVFAIGFIMAMIAINGKILGKREKKPIENDLNINEFIKKIKRTIITKFHIISLETFTLVSSMIKAVPPKFTSKSGVIVSANASNSLLVFRVS